MAASAQACNPFKTIFTCRSYLQRSASSQPTDKAHTNSAQKDSTRSGDDRDGTHNVDIVDICIRIGTSGTASKLYPVLVGK